MSNPVNPPPQLRIPDSLAGDRETFGYFRQLNQILFQLWVRTGGSDDAITSIENEEIFDPGIQTSNADELIEDLEIDISMIKGMVDEIDLSIPELDRIMVEDEVEVIGITASFTTTGDQIIICANTSDITVTLNATPGDGEKLHIKRQNTGAVTVAGDIDGDTSLIIGNRYSSPHLVFTVSAGEWSII